jgi:hypothetical protein
MSHTINNRETSEGDKAYYIDDEGHIHEDAIIKSIEERDGNHFAEIEYEQDGKTTSVKDIPHNTSPGRPSWNHPIVPEGQDEQDEEVSIGSNDGIPTIDSLPTIN